FVHCYARGRAMDEPAADWIEFTTPDGRTSRLRADNIGMVTRSSVGDAGIIHTSVGELIRVLNVTHVLRRWRHRLLFVVSRRAINHHRYLKHAFADVEWADVTVETASELTASRTDASIRFATCPSLTSDCNARARATSVR